MLIILILIFTAQITAQIYVAAGEIVANSRIFESNKKTADLYNVFQTNKLTETCLSQATNDNYPKCDKAPTLLGNIEIISKGKLCKGLTGLY